MVARRTLVVAVALVALMAVLLIGAVFAGSLSLNPRQQQAAWITCDVSRIAPGSTGTCGHFMVYRRTDADKLAVDRHVALLDDPQSLHSRQPESIRNAWRSSNPHYFVFLAEAPLRGCKVQLKAAGSIESQASWPEAIATSELPFFYESCDNRAWDTSGRLYRRPPWPAESNLTVPPTRWEGDTVLQVKFDLATLRSARAKKGPAPIKLE